MVSADRMLTGKVHGNRAPSDLLWCTETVHLGGVKPARVGVQVKPPRSCTVSVQLKVHGFGAPMDNQPTYVGTGQPIPSCTCVHDGPQPLPQPDGVVTQIGDFVVTKRPRARMVGCAVSGSSARWLTRAEWARVTALLGLTDESTPAEVIAALEARASAKNAANAAREAHWTAIRACRRCDPSGWRLDLDGLPIEPVIRCDHGIATHRPPDRDFSRPLHEEPTL